MDPISHIAFGRTLVALDGCGRLGAGAIAACVIGSLAPDIDAVYMPIGWDIYLRRHQGGTHSLLGSIACAALTAAVVRLSSRRGHYPSLMLAAWAGAAGHVLLDFISGADIRAFWPVGPRTALPLFAMADPWLGGILVLGLVLLAMRRAKLARTAALILIAVAVFAGSKAALYARAQVRSDTADRSVQSRRADVEWGALTRWVTYEARADTVEAKRVDGLTGKVTSLIHAMRGLQDPLVVKSQGLETVRNFLAAHDITFAIIVGGNGERRQVVWSDLRYCGPSEARSAPWAPFHLESASRVSCALWFGGEFNGASGVPEATVVYVGPLVQRRPIN